MYLAEQHWLVSIGALISAVRSILVFFRWIKKPILSPVKFIWRFTIVLWRIIRDHKQIDEQKLKNSHLQLEIEQKDNTIAQQNEELVSLRAIQKHPTLDCHTLSGGGKICSECYISSGSQVLLREYPECPEEYVCSKCKRKTLGPLGKRRREEMYQQIMHRP
jgi:hypothetical protein